MCESHVLNSSSSIKRIIMQSPMLLSSAPQFFSLINAQAFSPVFAFFSSFYEGGKILSSDIDTRWFVIDGRMRMRRRGKAKSMHTYIHPMPNFRIKTNDKQRWTKRESDFFFFRMCALCIFDWQRIPLTLKLDGVS